jgi:hypothetical protein
VERYTGRLDEVGFVGDVIVSSFNPLSIARAAPAARDSDRAAHHEYGVDADGALRFAAGQGHAWVLPFVAKVLEAARPFPARSTTPACCSGPDSTDDPDEAWRSSLGVDAIATERSRAGSSPPSRRRPRVIGPAKGTPGRAPRPLSRLPRRPRRDRAREGGADADVPAHAHPAPRPSAQRRSREYRTRLMRATSMMAAWAPARAGRCLAGCTDGLGPRDRAGDEAPRAGDRTPRIRGTAGARSSS